MKVSYLPYQPHCFAFGGFEIQMLGALEAVKKNGVNASALNPWSRSDDFDILHCWGLGLPHYENIHWAKRSGKKVVLTGLLPYHEFLIEKIRHLVSSYIRKNYFLLEMAAKVDAFTVLNNVQAEICHKHYKVPYDRIHIIPNIVSDRFYAAGNEQSVKEIFFKKYSFTEFVLTTGNVCARKNQLNLAKACIALDRKLVIIGKPLAGEEAYAQKVQELELSNKNILWIKGMPENSPELVSAYLNSSVFALPSYIENQPISLLEAAVLRKPLLIADRAYARQSYYQHACLVNPDSSTSIAEGLQKVFSQPQRHITPASFVEGFTELAIGVQYASVYKSLLPQ
jgi:glycosyltransferase involved in cell wall biosynthesis